MRDRVLRGSAVVLAHSEEERGVEMALSQHQVLFGEAFNLGAQSGLRPRARNSASSANTWASNFSNHDFLRTLFVTPAVARHNLGLSGPVGATSW